jgi:LemA protein
VTEARSAAMAQKRSMIKLSAEQQLTSALQGLRVQVEAYPDLKSKSELFTVAGRAK